jgi:hypothetical protein
MELGSLTACTTGIIIEILWNCFRQTLPLHSIGRTTGIDQERSQQVGELRQYLIQATGKFQATRCLHLFFGRGQKLNCSFIGAFFAPLGTVKQIRAYIFARISAERTNADITSRVKIGFREQGQHSHSYIGDLRMLKFGLTFSADENPLGHPLSVLLQPTMTCFKSNRRKPVDSLRRMQGAKNYFQEVAST